MPTGNIIPVFLPCILRMPAPVWEKYDIRGRQPVLQFV